MCPQCGLYPPRHNRRLCWRCQDASEAMRNYWRELGQPAPKCIVCGTSLSRKQVRRGVDFCTHGCWAAWKTGRRRTDQRLVANRDTTVSAPTSTLTRMTARRVLVDQGGA